MAQSLQSASLPRSASLKNWIAVSGSILGAFMAILDVSVTNASLQDIQGALSATLDEGAWISTAYLVAEIVVIPITGWLQEVFTTRIYLFTNATLFLFFSICCSWAWNLPSMIAFRACQGFTGGVLIPTASSIIITTLPPSQRTIGFALFGIAATFAPSIGPTIGGWLTVHFDWQFIFYLNLVPGALLLASVWFAIDPEPMKLSLLKRGDWLGIVTMAIGLGSFTTVLEEGNRDDWFSSDLIVQLTIAAVVFLSVFIWIELTRKNTFIDLRILTQRNFAASTLVSLALGVGVYSSVFLMPLYLTQIQGYNAFQIGEVLMWAGLPQLIVVPFVPRLIKLLDTRLLIAIGMGLFATSCFMNSTLTHESGLDQLRWSQIVRAMGQPLILTPLSTTAYIGLSSTQVGSASGLFNMARNLGGSIGIGLLGTLLTRREQFHSSRIGEWVSLSNLQDQQRIDQLTQFFTSKGADLVQAKQQAIALLGDIVRREAFVMAFNDCFYAMGCVLFLSAFAVLLLKKAKTAGDVAH